MVDCISRKVSNNKPCQQAVMYPQGPPSTIMIHHNHQTLPLKSNLKKPSGGNAGAAAPPGGGGHKLQWNNGAQNSEASAAGPTNLTSRSSMEELRV